MFEAVLPAIPVHPKTGEESFCQDGTDLPIKLLNFWQWYASDITNNALRGGLAEFLVSHVLGCVRRVRTEWDAFDLETPSGIKVEVKSAAYIQSWAQKKYSKIQFGISPTAKYDEKANAYVGPKLRHSDVYVFALLQHRDQNSINPLDTGQWIFYVLSTSVLNQHCRAQKQASLSRLLSLKPERVYYPRLAEAVDKAQLIRRS